MFIAYAQTSNCGTFQFGGCRTVTDLINAGVGTFFAVIWVVAIVFLAYAGIMYITSAGDKGKAGEAKQALTNALIGIAIVLGINVLTTLVGSLFAGAGTVATPTVGTGLPNINE
jgi:succinate dehydrogenase/fumarate reductase cytochrome b subunit